MVLLRLRLRQSPLLCSAECRGCMFNEDCPSEKPYCAALSLHGAGGTTAVMVSMAEMS